MNPVLKAILPPFVTNPLARRRSLAAAMKEHYRLENLGAELGNEHTRNLKGLPSRKALLEMLPNGGVAAEVGVAQGDFSQLILDICQPSRLHLIDYWGSSTPHYGDAGYRHVVKRFGEQISGGQVVLLRGWSWEMLARLPDESLDWVYIDADHSYDSVKKDLLAAKPKIRPHGILSGHDYIKWNSQTRRFGVVEAVNEFCVTFGFEMIYLALQKNMRMSYAIREM